MSTKSHDHMRCGTLRKSSISIRGYAEIHLQRPFFDNKNSIWKILGLKIQLMETCSSASSTCRNFYFWETLKSQFLVVFQSFIFGQILAVLARFGQNLLHWQWLRACPKQGWNLQNPIILKPWIQIYMECLIGKLPSISIASKSFKKSTNIMCSQHLAQKCKKPFWLPLSFRD
jgi:hypothetical protein